MKIRTLLVGAALLGLSSAAYAAPITVGGVTWDPTYDDSPFAIDFGAGLDFQQFWTTAGTETIDDTSADYKRLTATQIANPTTPGVGELVGLGQFKSINGLTNFVCATCSLNVAFGGLTVDGAGEFDITNSWFRVWSSPNEAQPFNVNRYNEAQQGTLWLEGVFDFFELQQGTFFNGSSNAFLSVTGGAAFANFDTNMFSNDFGDGVIESDLQLTGSAQFNAGNPFSQVGTLDVRGNSIPEPATLGILGLGLLGLGGMARRKKA